MKSKNYPLNGRAGPRGHQQSGRAGDRPRSRCARCLDVAGQVWTLKSIIMVCLVIALLIPVCVLTQSQLIRCGSVLISMAVLWATEALPIPVTALLPVVLFPAMGILEAKEAANSYMGNTSFLFIGGLMVAIAVEESGLHRRVALKVMSFVGSDPKWIMLGLMSPTWFLSMWISNTATASMMIPIVEAILVQLKIASKTGGEDSTQTNMSASLPSTNSIPDSANVQESQMGDTVADSNNATTVAREADNISNADNDDLHSNGTMTIANKHVRISVDDDAREDADDAASDDSSKDDDDELHQRLCKGLSLCVAYAANAGGIATLTGTPPNLVFAGQAKTYFNNFGGNPDVSFLKWMLMAFPLSLIMVLLCWIWLVIFFLRGSCLKKQPQAVSYAIKRVMQNEYKRLGKMSFAEIETLLCFLAVAALWLTRNPQFVPGWSSLFTTGYMSDSQAAVFISLLFFILPAKKPTIFCWRYKDGIRQKASYTPLLTWQVAQAKMPWGIIILLGGGFALAKGCTKSGLSDWFGDKLAAFDALDPWLLNLVICVAVAMVTEVTSNTATATLLMPIMAELAIKLKVNPLYFMSSSALATSFAFMMPVATPPNAIVFAHGHLKIPDMISAGAMMNIIAVLCLCLAVNTWGEAVFDFKTMPDIFANYSSSVNADDLRALKPVEA